jgi:hypothetical protein
MELLTTGEDHRSRDGTHKAQVARKRTFVKRVNL